MPSTAYLAKITGIFRRTTVSSLDRSRGTLSKHIYQDLLSFLLVRLRTGLDLHSHPQDETSDIQHQREQAQARIWRNLQEIDRF